MEELRRVEEFVRSHGLTIVASNSARRTVQVRGSVEQMNRAFGVALNRYRHMITTQKRGQPKEEIYRGRDGFIHLPTELREIVVGVFGLNNRTIAQRNSGVDPPGAAPLSTQEITKLYDFPTNFAAGQTIGIVSLGGYLMSDISMTFSGVGPQPLITDVSVDGGDQRQLRGRGDHAGYLHRQLSCTRCRNCRLLPAWRRNGLVQSLSDGGTPSPGDPLVSVISSSFYICDGDDPDTLTNEGVSPGPTEFRIRGIHGCCHPGCDYLYCIRRHRRRF